MKFIPYLGLAVGFATGATVQIPYASGKMVRSETVTFRPNPPPDSLRVGNVFTLRFFSHGSRLLVCGAKGVIGVQVLTAGNAETHGADTSWMRHAVYPSAVSSMMRLDSIGPDTLAMPAGRRYPRAPGYEIAHPGEYNDCSGALYAFAEGYRRVIYLRNGNTYAKFKIVAHAQTDENPTPMMRYTHLTSITIRMVVNTSSSGPVDLVDPDPPASLRSPSKRLQRGSVGAAKGFYNPLGIQLGPEPAPFSPALPKR